MDKPEDIPSGIWDMAYEALHPITKKNYEISPHAMVQHLGIARAILSAQSQAYTDAARIAEEAHESSLEGHDPDDPSLVMLGAIAVSRAISAALLQRKEEIGR